MGFDFDLPHGYFRSTGDNETTVVSTKEDPPKHRLGVLAQFINAANRTLGALSFNKVSSVEDEVVLVQGKQSDLGGGELWIGLEHPTIPDPNNDVKEIFTIDWTRGAEFKVPIKAPNLQGGGSVGSQLVSPNGKWLLNMQDDGNLVKYENVNGSWVPRWWTGV